MYCFKHLFLRFFPFFFVLIAINGRGQISEGGKPYSFSDFRLSDEIVMIKMPQVDNYLLLQEENKSKTDGFQFGKEFDVDLNLMNAGIWTQLANGDRLWRLGISSQGAYSINLVFDRFYLPATSNLFIYTKSKDYVLGAFTEKNNLPERVFSTTLLPGDEIVIEYYEPIAVKGQGEIHLSTVVHAYKDFFFQKGYYGKSGSCNININCSEGIPYVMVKRAVALILNVSSAHCTGTLINNTANNGVPYFLTANHCVINKNLARFVFIFGYETQYCDGTNGMNGFSINGASLVASGVSSDFALLKLSSVPPLSYLPYYAGWNRVNSPAMSAVAIHHPSGDYKKISVCNTPLESSSYSEYTSNTHWKVNRWYKGTTEGGSSGSSLFNTKKQILGQLEGGTASCTNRDGYDVFGKLSYSWDNEDNPSPNKRLKDWLDPLNTGATTLEGYDPTIPKYQYDVAITKINCPTDYICTFFLHPEVTIENLGENTLQKLRIYYQIDGFEADYFDWTGSLSFAEAEKITLPKLAIADGIYSLSIWTSQPNGQTDENTVNDTMKTDFIYQRGISFRWDVKTDIYPDQTSWVLKDAQGNIIARNADNLFVNTRYIESFCLDTGCYDFVIYDSNGDGINGENGMGAGYYYVYLNERLILSGSEFGDKDSVRFCIDESSAIKDRKNIPSIAKVNIFPNPAQTTVNVLCNDVLDKETLTATVFTIDGKKLMEHRINKENNILNFSTFENGIYIVKIKGKNHFSAHKLIIQR